MRFSIRRLLGLITAACILLAAYKLVAGTNYAASGCVLALLAALIPAVLTVGVAGTSGYSRAALIAGLAPALLAAGVFVAGLIRGYGNYIGGHDLVSFWPVVAQMVYFKWALALLWFLVPICMVGGVAAHWFLRND